MEGSLLYLLCLTCFAVVITWDQGHVLDDTEQRIQLHLNSYGYPTLLFDMRDKIGQVVGPVRKYQTEALPYSRFGLVSSVVTKPMLCEAFRDPSFNSVPFVGKNNIKRSFTINGTQVEVIVSDSEEFRTFFIKTPELRCISLPKDDHITSVADVIGSSSLAPKARWHICSKRHIVEQSNKINALDDFDFIDIVTEQTVTVTLEIEQKPSVISMIRGEAKNIETIDALKGRLLKEHSVYFPTLLGSTLLLSQGDKIAADYDILEYYVSKKSGVNAVAEVLLKAHVVAPCATKIVVRRDDLHRNEDRNLVFFDVSRPTSAFRTEVAKIAKCHPAALLLTVNGRRLKETSCLREAPHFRQDQVVNYRLLKPSKLEIQVHVGDRNSHVELFVHKLETVADLKTTLTSNLKVDDYKLQITFKEEILSQDELLKRFIGREPSLHAHVMNTALSIKLIIQDPRSASDLVVNDPEKKTVHDIVKIASKELSREDYKYRLIYNGHCFSGNALLSDIGLQSGDTVVISKLVTTGPVAECDRVKRLTVFCRDTPGPTELKYCILYRGSVFYEHHQVSEKYCLQENDFTLQTLKEEKAIQIDNPANNATVRPTSPNQDGRNTQRPIKKEVRKRRLSDVGAGPQSKLSKLPEDSIALTSSAQTNMAESSRTIRCSTGTQTEVPQYRKSVSDFEKDNENQVLKELYGKAFDPIEHKTEAVPLSHLSSNHRDQPHSLELDRTDNKTASEVVESEIPLTVESSDTSCRSDQDKTELDLAAVYSEQSQSTGAKEESNCEGFCSTPGRKYLGGLKKEILYYSEHGMCMKEESYKKLSVIKDSSFEEINSTTTDSEMVPSLFTNNELPQGLTRKKLNRIARGLGANWQLVGHELEVHDEQLEEIDHTKAELREKAYRMLVAWFKMQGKKANIKQLREALKECNLNNLADEHFAD